MKPKKPVNKLQEFSKKDFDKMVFIDSNNPDTIVWDQIPYPTDESIKIMLNKYHKLAKKFEKKKKEFFFIIDIRKRETIGTATQRESLARFSDSSKGLKQVFIITKAVEYDVYTRFVLSKSGFEKFSIHHSLEEALDLIKTSRN